MKTHKRLRRRGEKPIGKQHYIGSLGKPSGRDTPYPGGMHPVAARSKEVTKGVNAVVFR